MSRAFFAEQHQQLEWIGGTVMEVLLDSSATAGQLFLARTRLQAGDAAPMHLHHDEDEMFLLLAGHGFFWFGDEELEARTGAVVYLPRDVPHGYHFVADSDLLTFCTPAGIEGFFRAAGHDLAEPKPADWQLTPATLGAAAASLGIEILGPPRVPTLAGRTVE